MDQLQKAKEIYLQYLNEGLQMFPPFKGYGMKLVQFSMDYPELFEELFLNTPCSSIDEYLETVLRGDLIIPVIQQFFNLNEKEAKWLFRCSFFYCQGIFALRKNQTIPLSTEDILRDFGALCRGMIMEMKAQADERINIIPMKDQPFKGDLKEYIEGKKKTVVGYGDEKEVYQIKLDSVYYFEAVGDKLFAYTKSNVFEVKKRLYQIEELTGPFNFIRISKAMIVNVKKIESISSLYGGRGSIVLTNGETVISSRNYYRQVVEEIKNKE